MLNPLGSNKRKEGAPGRKDEYKGSELDVSSDARNAQQSQIV